VTNRGGSIYVNKTGVYAVSKEGTPRLCRRHLYRTPFRNVLTHPHSHLPQTTHTDGLVLLPPVKPPTKQAEKMQRRNETVPHVGVPIEDLPHEIDTPGAGNSGPDDPFMHASLPTADDDDENAPAPAPSPWLARWSTTPTSILVIDSRLESVKAPPPKVALFQKALRRQRRLRERRLAASAFPGAARVLQPVLGKWSPMDVVEAFKASGQAREEGSGATQEEGGKAKEVRIRVLCILIRPNTSTGIPRLYFTRTTQHNTKVLA